MPKIAKEVYKKTEGRIFNDAELSKFHDELQSFKGSYTLRNGDTVKYIDFDAYHKSKNTLSADGGVTVQFDFEEIISPTRYERLEEKIRQYKLWLGRKEYGRKMEAKALDAIAEEMTIEIDANDISFNGTQ